jgi:hypothetical protein
VEGVGMSVYFYAVCDTHKRYTYITDNKGNSPEHEIISGFMSDHFPVTELSFHHLMSDPNDDCHLRIISEYEIDELGYIEYADPELDELPDIGYCEADVWEYRKKEELE